MTVLINYNGDTRRFHLEGELIEITLNGDRNSFTKRIEHNLNELNLSYKQWQVLKLTAEGKTARQIAPIVKGSVRTIENIKVKLKDTLGYNSQMEMIVDLVRKKMI